MRSTVQMYFAANNILMMRNWDHVIKIWKQTWWSNGKTIIELGYRKLSKYLSVSRKIDLFATRKNRDILLNLVLVWLVFLGMDVAMWNDFRKTVDGNGGKSCIVCIRKHVTSNLNAMYSRLR